MLSVPRRPLFPPPAGLSAAEVEGPKPEPATPELEASSCLPGLEGEQAVASAARNKVAINARIPGGPEAGKRDRAASLYVAIMLKRARITHPIQ